MLTLFLPTRSVTASAVTTAATTSSPSPTTSFGPAPPTGPPPSSKGKKKANNLLTEARTKAVVESAVAPLQAQIAAMQERMDAQHAELLKAMMPYSVPPTPVGLRDNVHDALSA